MPLLLLFCIGTELLFNVPSNLSFCTLKESANKAIYERAKGVIINVKVAIFDAILN